MSAAPTSSLLRRIGPGILVAATGVGAGDLVTAGLAGGRFGLTIIWAVAFGALLKWCLNESLARWQMATGTTLLEGWARHLKIHWLFLPYLLLWGFAVAGALMSACGVAALALVPLGGDPDVAKRVWGVLHAVAGVLLVWIGGYRLFERLMAVCIGLMFTSAVLCAIFVIPDLDWSAVRSVNPLAMRGESIPWALALIGGVGGTVTLLSYGYWIREEGRAGREGVRLCRVDLAVGYGMTAFFGAAMIVIAASTPDLRGSGASLLVVLSDRLGEKLGWLAKYTFLVGAWGAVFTSLLGVWQGAPYLLADFLRALRGPRDVQAERPLTQTGAYRAFLLYLAVPPMVLLWQSLEWVQLAYTILGALFMPLLAATLLLMNNHRGWMPAEFRNSAAVNAMLALTLLFFLWYGGVALGEAMGILPKSGAPLTG